MYSRLILSVFGFLGADSVALTAQEAIGAALPSPPRVSLAVEIGSFNQIGLPFEIGPSLNDDIHTSGAALYGGRATVHLVGRLSMVASATSTRPTWRIDHCSESCPSGAWQDKVDLFLYDVGVRATLFRSNGPKPNELFIEVAGGGARERVGDLQMKVWTVKTNPSYGAAIGAVHHVSGGFFVTLRAEDRFIRFAAPVNDFRVTYRPNVLLSIGFGRSIF